MSASDDRIFNQHRTETFDKVIALIEGRVRTAVPAVLLRFDEVSLDALRGGAEKEVWGLFLSGIRHLKSGAPGGGAGALTEALARTSLRAGTLAASLGVAVPQFEQLSVDAKPASGYDAAIFSCRRLVE